MCTSTSFYTVEYMPDDMRGPARDNHRTSDMLMEPTTRSWLR